NAQGLDELVIPLKFKTPTSEDGLVFTVKSANDDVEEQPDGSINVSSSDLEMVKDAEDQTVGIRFADISIAKNEKIRHAYIQFTAKDAADEATSLQIGLQDSGNAAEFGSSAHNVTSRTLLAEPIAWTPAAWENAGDVTEAQRTPDLTKLIRQIVNRSDWQKGNALAFVISGSGKRNAKAFVSDAKDAPRLIIEPFDRPEANIANKLSHTIRLTFAELDADIQPGQRIFSVSINGQIVEEDLDVVAATGGTHLGIVKEYANVRLDDELRVRFIPKEGQPICSGIEVILED
ncbi:MAG: hypothetical protein KDA87_27165, partial [Planctomycetales bacterium]|nr:hypothetical protein [Planctomycetales bacterium]